MTSEQARNALIERLATCPEFAKSLQRPEITGVEDEEEVDEDDPMNEGAVLYDEIDSSKMIPSKKSERPNQPSGDPGREVVRG